MADIRAFQALRPAKDSIKTIADLDYDNVKAKIENGELYQYHNVGYYIYEVKNGDHVQNGILAAASVDDYINEVIRSHDAIETDLDAELAATINESGVQLDPVILAYNDQAYINKLIDMKKTWAGAPLFQFTDIDGLVHTVYSVDEKADLQNFEDALAGINQLYVVEGQEIAASIADNALVKRAHDRNYDKDAAYNYFLALLVPYSTLKEDGYWEIESIYNGLLSYKF